VSAEADRYRVVIRITENQAGGYLESRVSGKRTEEGEWKTEKIPNSNF